ncbi:hypothetical protein WNY37_04745 [Henriciella sp. AS95]|uniref:glucosamine inositolphosphorylceramide transferase family protein n=1 Tax=Henriciella sp. AS95 TaxID=3135782 RepID=UPI0031815D03
MAEGICRDPGLELCGLIVSSSDASEPVPENAIFRLWWKLERRFAAKPMAAECGLFETYLESVTKTDVSDKASVLGLGADVVIDLSVDKRLDHLAGEFRYGIWAPSVIRDGVGNSAMHAIVKASPVTDIHLVHVSGTNQPRSVIASAALNTKFVVSRNHLFMCEKTVTLILRELKRASLNALDMETLKPAPDAVKSTGIADLALYSVKLIAGLAARVIEKIATKAGLRPGMFFLKTMDSDISGADPSIMQPHTAPSNEYYADPFLWEKDGETFCFFEVFDYATQKGHISAGRLGDNGLEDVAPVLKTDYHLSFPFLFEYQDELFMMPETCGAKRIETWRCVEFPHKWVREATILDDVIAADSSLVQIGEDWWLFTNISTDPFGEMNSELHLYKADSPAMTKLTPHALNPVVFDTRTARNGGRILEQDGAYFRMSQDNSHGRYGYGLNVMKIDHISLNDYRETMVRKIEPDFEPGVIGCHHMDARGDKVVIDVRRRVGGYGARSRAERSGGVGG